MSRLFRATKRRGGHCKVVQFRLEVLQLQVSEHQEFEHGFVWVRGSRTAASSYVKGTDGIFKWTSIMALNCTLYQDKKERFIEKKSRIVLKRRSGQNSSKNVGEVSLDLAELANDGKRSLQTYAEALSKCHDKKARLQFRLSIDDDALDGGGGGGSCSESESRFVGSVIESSVIDGASCEESSGRSVSDDVQCLSDEHNTLKESVVRLQAQKELLEEQVEEVQLDLQQKLQELSEIPELPLSASNVVEQETKQRIGHLESKCQHLNQKLSLQSKELAQRQSEVDESRNEIHRIEEVLQEKELEIEELQERQPSSKPPLDHDPANQRWREESEDLRTRLEQEKAKSKKLHDEQVELRQQVETMRDADAVASRSELQQMQLQLDLLRQENEKLLRTANDTKFAKVKDTNLDEELRSLQTRFYAVQEENDELLQMVNKAKRSTSKNESAHDELQSLRIKFDVLREENDELMHTANEASRWKDHHRQLKESFERLQAQSETLKEENEELQRVYKRASSHAQELELENKKLREDVSEIEKQYELLSMQRESMRGKTIRVDAAGHLQEVDTVQLEEDRNHTELHDLQREHNLQVTHLQDEISKLNYSESSGKHSPSSDVKTMRSLASDGVDNSYQDLLTELEKRLSSTSVRLVDTVDTLNEMEMKNSLLKSEVKRLTAMLQKSRTKLK